MAEQCLNKISSIKVSLDTLLDKPESQQMPSMILTPVLEAKAKAPLLLW